MLTSTAMPFHAAAAASRSAAPAPPYMRAELTSGGRAPKSTEAFRFWSSAVVAGAPSEAAIIPSRSAPA